MGSTLYMFFLLKSEDASLEDICNELQISVKDYKKLSQELKQSWHDYNT
jgi:hypothetical protein